MGSQDTIEDPTLYQDKQTQKCKQDSQDEEDKERARGLPSTTISSSPPSQLGAIERMRLLVTQLDGDFTQLKECMEKTTSTICCVTTRLKELGDALDTLRNEVDQTKVANPKGRKKRGILKRAHEEADDGYQPRTSPRRIKKKARVTRQGQ